MCVGAPVVFMSLQMHDRESKAGDGAKGEGSMMACTHPLTEYPGARKISRHRHRTKSSRRLSPGG